MTSDSIILVDYLLPSKKFKFIVSLVYYGGNPKLDIREYYLDGSEYKPGRKGIQLDIVRTEALISALEKNKILVSNHFLKNQSTLVNVEKTLVLDVALSNPVQFFDVRVEGGVSQVVFNPGHPIGRVFFDFFVEQKGTADAVAKLIPVLFSKFVKATSMFDPESKSRFDDVLDDLLGAWSKFLRE